MTNALPPESDADQSQQSETVIAQPLALLALIALLLGAAAMGASPIFVRLADVGPFSSAFWRLCLALPFLWLWMRLADREKWSSSPYETFHKHWRTCGLAGLFFAGDLFFWHLAILNTTVANATLFATMMPIVVALGSWLVLRERLEQRIVIGVALGVAGAAFLAGSSVQFAVANLRGDGFGILTAFFFGSYVLAIATGRKVLPAATLMFFSVLVSTVILFFIAIFFEDRVLPGSLQGLMVLLGLALVSQVGGHGLMTYALGHLPTVFSSLVIFFEAVAAAFFGWLFFSEALSYLQVIGGVLIFAGIYAARPRKTTTPELIDQGVL